MNYIPVNEKEKKEMLESVGIKDASELFSVIPKEVRIAKLNLPEGISEQKLAKELERLAGRNISAKDYTTFLGAGIYEHFIPAVVREITGRSEFSTAYTPYQPEASQGTLQAIFEYQSMIAELTGLDVSNASLYDGASAVAEAALLCARQTGKKKILVSKALHPEYRKVLSTYLEASDIKIVEIEVANGATSAISIKNVCCQETAGLIIQSPNFFGVIEDMQEFAELAHASGALFAAVVNPLSLGILKSPGEYGADIAIGEGQVLGNQAGLGGFTFGFLAVKKDFAWKIPGRIVGQTTDNKGARGYVLTLQSREQHIRREKATSNICTNSALNALGACVYMSGWGPEGLKKLGELNISKSRYAFEQIIKIKGFSPAFPTKPFFNEFVIKTDKDAEAISKHLLSNKIIGPLALAGFYKDMPGALLFCVTETKTKEDIDKLVKTLAVL
jgi:glycine dehydrogenase subunit 1